MKITDWFNIKLGLVCVFLCFTVQSEAKITLPALLSDGMVLQRDCIVKIWGTSDAGEKVNLAFCGKTYQTVADEQGNWIIGLSPLKAGGPYDMQINEITLHDILIGDVFLCSGQSNMELMVSRVMDKFADEVKSYENPMIHYIKVPYNYNFRNPQADIRQACWQALTQENVMGYSALCYFFAKLLYQQTGIPVGIVNSSWGGTPVEAWISENGLKDFPSYLNQKSMYECDSLVDDIQRIERMRQQVWQAVLCNADEGLHSSIPWYAETLKDDSWQTVDMFSDVWATNGWKPKNGSHWFHQQIEIPEAWSNKDVTLRLGCMVDADSVYVNGSFVGTTSYQYPPRIYQIPAGVLRSGTNQITIRLISNGGYPSFVKEKPYKLICGKEEITLSPTWKYHVRAEMPPAPASTSFHCMPVGLYNGMIAPLANYRFKGVVWYQGESNVDRWQEYAPLLTSLMKDWRTLFNNEELPFYIVELADFLAPDDPGRQSWAELRLQQAKAARSVKHAVLIKNSDTGEWNDIHPLDKKTAGTRLVEAVLSVD